MDYDGFLNKWLGKSIDWDGMYGPQCVDEVAQYCTDNGKPVAYANAKDWADNPALRTAFDWIANDPNQPNQLPTRGDIVVFGGNSPGSGGYGHINIFDMITSPNNLTWQGLDQNWGGQYVHFVPNHVWTYVLGWWTPKGTPPPAPVPTPAPDVHPDPVPPAPTPAPVTPPAPTPEPVVTPPVEPPKPVEPPVTPVVVQPPSVINPVDKPSKPVVVTIKAKNLFQRILDVILKFLDIRV